MTKIKREPKVSAKSTGGRPRKFLPAPAESMREKLLVAIEKSTRPRGTRLNVDDGEICARIASAKRGELAHLIRELAKRKRISERAAWTLRSEAIERGQWINGLVRLVKDGDGGLRELLRSEPNALAAIGNLSAKNAPWLAQQLRDVSPSKYHELIATIIEIGTPHS